jgi:hypothetical protein
MILLGLGSWVLGTWFIVATMTSKIVLYPDAIEVASAFGRRRLECKEIRAKLKTIIYVPAFILYPNEIRAKPMMVAYPGKMDDYFFSWMADIPDADPEFLRSRLLRRFRRSGSTSPS